MSSQDLYISSIRNVSVVGLLEVPEEQSLESRKGSKLSAAGFLFVFPSIVKGQASISFLLESC